MIVCYVSGTIVDGDPHSLTANAQKALALFGDKSVAGVRQKSKPLPTTYQLCQNYPNPFNPTTTVSFAVSHSSLVTLVVYDVLGRQVAMLVNEVKQPGEYTVPWNAEGIASGIYFYRLTTPTFTETKCMVLMK